MINETESFREMLSLEEQVAVDAFTDLLADLLIKYREDSVAAEPADAA